MTALAPSLQAYFTQRLIGERAASPNTIASYKLTFQLLLAFASSAAKKAPSNLDIADLDAPLIPSFLEHLQQGRRNSVATRNSRLAAIHSLFSYLALRHPEHAGSIQRVLAVPPKRAERMLLAGNDITVIALWLGHEQVTTTQIYLHADMSHKQRAIERTRPLGVEPGRYRPSDTILAFLQAL